MKLISEIHEKALRLAREYKHVEAELVSVIQEVDRLKVFYEYGYTSTFEYVLKALGLSESCAYTLISVSRKAREIPEIKQALEEGKITVSKVKKVISVMTPENQGEWLEKVGRLSQKKLEEEVARIAPLSVTEERVKMITEDIRELRIPVTKELFRKLERVKDLKKTESMQEVLETVLSFYLEKRDPLTKKATVEKTGTGKVPTEPVRTVLKNSHPESSHIPNPIRREVMKRDSARCTYTNFKGERCANTRYIEVHHIEPRANGGPHTRENLRILCSAHHKIEHDS